MKHYLMTIDWFGWAIGLYAWQAQIVGILVEPVLAVLLLRRLIRRRRS